ncbi:hypothetical protein J1TS1_28250 [Shouchella clausii]|nr:hypothetical protein J1TS1_28250 [Shouchella clausii]
MAEVYLKKGAFILYPTKEAREEVVGIVLVTDEGKEYIMSSEGLTIKS